VRRVRTVTKTQLMLFIIGISCLGVAADAVLKLASSEQSLLRSKWLLCGLSLSCVFAIGWVFLMREMKLATAGIAYGVISALLLCVIGVLCFGEKLSRSELAGIAAGAVAIVLLGRTSD
jgi:drug/metabolite transporter (DMT)-like permease